MTNFFYVSYTAETKIGGVIYLHDISAGSMDATTLKNLEIFQKLCGPDGSHSFILGTTKWDSVKPSVGGLREEQLLNDYWKNMIDNGSLAYRFDNTHQSAWNMVDKILDGVELERNTGALLLQKELVDLQKRIPDTEAGRVLRYTL
ncbi:hypothetical protein BDQ17DRAFT_1424657 [Cyathus striatus]|nr:hypothetical protein BDQ17DRAFT_1424657 [Cyathus striatus]